MRILLAQLNYTIGSFTSNRNKILNAIEQAKQQDCKLLVTSELALCGYPPHDFLLHSDFIIEMQQSLDSIIAASQGLSLIIGLARKNDSKKGKALFNSAAIISNGKLIGFQDKALLPTYDVFDESRYFESGNSFTTWDLEGLKIGVTICEDIWQHSGQLEGFSYHIDPVQELAKSKPDLLINISASPYDFNKPNLRKNICQKIASHLSCPILLCNQVGGNDSLIFDGYSCNIGADTTLINQAKGFEEDLFITDTTQDPAPLKDSDPYHDLYQALIIGLRDYFHKSHFTKACFGLSGGIDSALVACLATEALGHENILAVLMPSRYSSKESVTDALELCERLHIAHHTISIEEPFSTYLKLLEPLFKEQESDITEENLQARIRGMIMMALSNKFGYITLSTGNKSELAIGYSTLYGDSCGGLAIINDLTKTQVYALSKWLNQEKELIPLNTLEKPPSAELRPNQKDSDSLPEYELIDQVLEAYIEEHKSIPLIAKDLNISLDLITSLIQKIHQSEYKRRQNPPGLRVTRKAFSIGRHFPIVQDWIK